MSRDYAKKSGTGSRKTPPRKKPATRSKDNSAQAGSVWRWYFAGLLSGVFLSFLLYLGTLPGGTGLDQGAGNGQAKAESETPPKPRFDFYTMLPEQEIEVDEPAQQPSRNAATTQPDAYYLLQAGSFRQREDADRRRAELLLLGLEPSVEEAQGENGRWFRVYLGPFESRSKMSRARSLTAAQNIDTLLLKRSG
jgi:hypothetical protein